MKSKKILAIVLATSMMLGSSITALADEPVTSGGTNGSGTNEGHVEKELINVVLPTVPEGSTPFAYTMDPERLIQATSAAKYAEGTTFPEAEDDTGVYFLTGEKTYANESSTLQAINKSSCAIKLTVKVKTTQNTDKDIALATTSTVATETAPNLYLGLKVGETTQVVSATEASVEKVIAGNADNFEIAVKDGDYVYQEKASASTWKAMNLSMEGAVSELAAAEGTTAPTVNVTWEYAKAADDATASDDAVDYSAGPSVSITSAGVINVTNLTAEKNFKSISLTGSDGTTVDYDTCVRDMAFVVADTWTAEDGGFFRMVMPTNYVEFWDGATVTATVTLSDDTTIVSKGVVISAE